MNEHITDKSLPYRIYQIKISLKEVKPSIWRRFQVPDNISLYKLHKIIQVLMAWDDYHLFEFKINDIPYGIPDKDGFDDVKNAKRYKLNKVLQDVKKAHYAYDFGDGWEIGLHVEKIIASETEMKHPVCLNGKRSAPPEDCGGPWGYENYLKILETPPDENEDDEIKERREWIGEDFDPEYFNLEEINQELKRIS
jgi:hypothetical protein